MELGGWWGAIGAIGGVLATFLAFLTKRRDSAQKHIELLGAERKEWVAERAGLKKELDDTSASLKIAIHELNLSDKTIIEREIELQKGRASLDECLQDRGALQERIAGLVDREAALARNLKRKRPKKK